MKNDLINIKQTNNIFNITKKNEKFLLNKFNTGLKDQNIIYKKELYPLCMNPIILNLETLGALKDLSSKFNLLLKDSLDIFKKNKEIFKETLGDHPLYNFLKDNLDFMNIDEIDNIFIRLDGIIIDNKIKIIEANTNSPGGVFTLEKIHELSNSIYSEFFNADFNFLKGSEVLLKHFINIYKKKFSNGELFVIIGDKNDEERFEHRLISKKLRENGIPSRTLDYRDKKIKINGKNIFYKDKKIGVIYRRSFPLDANEDIIRSSKIGNTKILNNPFSKLLGSKSMLAFFHKFKNNKLAVHKKFIENNITYSCFFHESNKEEIISNKDKYVIKETSFNCGKGVYIGKAESVKSWKKIVNDSNPNNVVQKYYEQPKMKFIDNKVRGPKNRKFDFNLYSIGNKLMMPYIRINAESSYKSNSACGGSEGVCFFGGNK